MAGNKFKDAYESLCDVLRDTLGHAYETVQGPSDLHGDQEATVCRVCGGFEMHTEECWVGKAEAFAKDQIAEIDSGLYPTA